MPQETPVLLIVWRRPHTTRQVIDALRLVAPTQLYIAGDGPRLDRPGEAAQVATTRALIERQIDWPCKLQFLYSDVNLGCRRAVLRAITWFFEQVTEGIILEDDCVPHPDFFRFCTELLDRYRHDDRVWSICGSQFLPDRYLKNPSSYWASIHGDSWGWATWRRCWQQLPGSFGRWPAFRDSATFAQVFSGADEAAYWTEIIHKLITLGQPDSWFYQWLLAGWQQGALSLWPQRNLVSHIGSGPLATHCQGDSPYLHRPLQALPAGLLQHPQQLRRDRQRDRALYWGRRDGWRQALQRRLGPLYPWWLRFQNYSRRLARALQARLQPDLARKVRWRMRYERSPWMVTCTDKWAVRAWAAARDVATTPLLAVAERLEDLPWAALPDRCLLKASHGSSWNLLRWDGRWYRFGDGDQFIGTHEGLVQASEAEHCWLSEAEAQAIASTWLASIYCSRQWAYSQVQPRLLVEALLEPARAGSLFDYRFYVMRGQVRAIGVGCPYYRRHGLLALFDQRWQLLPVRNPAYDLPLELPDKPVHFEAMLAAAQRLSRDLSFARIDLYDTSQGPVLGEVTVYPQGGCTNPTEDPRFNRWLVQPWKLGWRGRWQAFWL